jgi:hypothetical protein
MAKRIVFLVASETSKGVLVSQVLELATSIAKESHGSVSVYLIGEYIDIGELGVFDTIDVKYVDDKKSVTAIANSIIYIRGVDIFSRFWFFLKLRGNRVVYDFRALVCFESYFRNRSIWRFLILFIQEFCAYILADNVSCVSNKMRRTLLRLFRVKRDCFVFPCLLFNGPICEVSKERKEPIKFVYVGSLSKWQMFEETIAYYKHISSLLNASLTIITNSANEVVHVLKKEGVSANVLNLSQPDVLIELGRHDFGFLIREDLILNRIASPIKFLEYIASGVIPIISDCVGDYSDEVVKYNIGVVVREGRVDIKDLSVALNDDTLQARLAKYYEQNYSLEDNIKSHPLLL